MKLIFKDKILSTNLEALSSDDESEFCIIANEQISGKGRYNRNWKSPKGNLYASIKLNICDLQESCKYSFLTAVAISMVLEDFNLIPQCKWPNDVLIDGKKISGILLQTNGKNRLVVGMGINIKPFTETTDFLYSSTSLIEYGIDVAPIDLFKEILKKFISLRDVDFCTIVTEWKKRAVGLGKKIEVHLENKILTGIFSGIDDNGILLLDDDGVISKITAGDVFFGKKE
ncbi:MAG: biotin--[acetyl-CoA-carboxylase] ligase [Alphaproteobacteria bacterium]|nr:biotin--[acetyl-CoA-carboxylase] ligase [Alphaproteobacteria bacterium]